MTTNKSQPYELTLYFNRPRFADMVHIQSASDVYQYLQDRIDPRYINHKEYCWILLTTRANRVLGLKEVSSGSDYTTVVPLKEIAQLCLLANASGCFLIHNHPSGNLKPSQCDRHVTKKATAMLDLIEVTLIDHLIITQEGYFSFAEHHLLAPP